MIESHLKAGTKRLLRDNVDLWRSIADACLSWDDTVPLLRELAQAVQKRRTVNTDRSVN